MQLVDDRILEYLRDHGPASPEVLATTLSAEASRARIAERCQALARAGWIAPQMRGGRVYEITIWGLLYLRGKIDASHNNPYRRYWNAGTVYVR